MSKKMLGNGLFESSRMMLPEHKEAYLVHQHRLDRRDRPVLDSQQVEQYSQFIAESMLMEKEIIITTYDEYVEKRLTGKVVKIEQENGRLRISKDGSWEWIYFSDVIHICPISR